MRLFATSQRINVDRKFVFNYPKERLDAGALSVTVHLTKHDDDGCDTCFDLIIGCNMTLDVNVRFLRVHQQDVHPPRFLAKQIPEICCDRQIFEFISR